MDSGIELNEQDPSSSVVHRSHAHPGESDNDSAEILDQEQQQQVIDNLTKDYEHMVKSQRYSFIILTIIVSAVTIFASYSTGSHKVLLPAAASYLSLLLAEFLLHSSIRRRKISTADNDKGESQSSSPTSNNINTWWIWAITASFEGFSIYSSLRYGILAGSFKQTPIIILHIGYLILLAFLASSQRFSQTFPEEIKNLQKLKYGSKLA